MIGECKQFFTVQNNFYYFFYEVYIIVCLQICAFSYQFTKNCKILTKCIEKMKIWCKTSNYIFGSEQTVFFLVEFKVQENIVFHLKKNELKSYNKEKALKKNV